jgi:hypothetical protein
VALFRNCFDSGVKDLRACLILTEPLPLGLSLKTAWLFDKGQDEASFANLSSASVRCLGASCQTRAQATPNKYLRAKHNNLTPCLGVQRLRLSHIICLGKFGSFIMFMKILRHLRFLG